jgi:hypothetical protein
MELTMNKFIDYLNSQEYHNLLEEMEKAQGEYENLSKEFFDSLSYDDKLKVFYHVVKNIHDGCLVDQGSYRHILYTKFNFGPDSYALGMDCGMLELNNSIYSHKEISEALKDVFAHLNIEIDKRTFYNMCDRFVLGKFGSTNFRDRTIQLSLDFNDN